MDRRSRWMTATAIGVWPLRPVGRALNPTAWRDEIGALGGFGRVRPVHGGIDCTVKTAGAMATGLGLAPGVAGSRYCDGTGDVEAIAAGSAQAIFTASALTPATRPTRSTERGANHFQWRQELDPSRSDSSK